MTLHLNRPPASCDIKLTYCCIWEQVSRMKGMKRRRRGAYTYESACVYIYIVCVCIYCNYNIYNLYIL